MPFPVGLLGATPPVRSPSGVSSTSMMVAKPGDAGTLTTAQASAWAALGVKVLTFGNDAGGGQRLSPGMGGAVAWTGASTGLPTYQAGIISNGSVANAHNAGCKVWLAAELDSGGTLGASILGYWNDDGPGGYTYNYWWPGQFATASTTITTSATGTITVGSTAAFPASGTINCQTAIGIPSVPVAYTGKTSTTLTGCSVASGTFVITSGTSLIGVGRIREAIQCFAAAAASMGMDGLLLDCEPYHGENNAANPAFNTSLSSALSTGAPITSLPINAPTHGTITGAGYPVILTEPGGHTQTFISSGASTSSAVPVVSQTPTFAYPASTTAVQYGRFGWSWDSSATATSNNQATITGYAQADGQLFMQWLADAWAAYATGANPTPVLFVMDTLFSAVVLNNGTPFHANTQGSIDEAVIFSVDGGSVFQSSVYQAFWAGALAATSAGMPSAILFGTEILYRGPQGVGCAINPPWYSTQGAAACLDMCLAYMHNTGLSALSQQATSAAWAAMQHKVFMVPSLWIDGDGSGGGQGFPDNITDVTTLLGNGSVGKFPKWTSPNVPFWLYQNAGGSVYQPQPASGTNVGFNYKTGSRNGVTGATGPNYSNTDYTSQMENVLTAYHVGTHPVFGTFTPVSGGSHAHGALTITGIATSDSAIASVAYTVNGGAVQGAVMTLDLLAGSFTAGWAWQMNFSAAATLVTGPNTVVFTATDIHGDTTTYTWICTGT